MEQPLHICIYCSGGEVEQFARQLLLPPGWRLTCAACSSPRRAGCCPTASRLRPGFRKRAIQAVLAETLILRTGRPPGTARTVGLSAAAGDAAFPGSMRLCSPRAS